MNFLSFFLLVACLNVSAGVYSQKVTLSGEGIPLKQVFKEIKKQTGYTFVYREVLLQKAANVTLHVSNATVDQVLDLCFKNQPIGYAIIGGNLIVVKEKDIPPPQHTEAAAPVLPVRISGKVYNEAGEPLPNANVVEKGKANGVRTKPDGSFEIDVESAKSVLVISFVGFENKEVVVGNQTELSIKLKPAPVSMNDVVVVGYGTQKRATVTGAVEKVTSATFENRAVTNVGLALQGQTPGLVVTRTSPRPGNEGIAFQIRGITSTNGGSPLIIIDGVPAIHGSALQQMNPDDIDNISIIKDGAAAIYGAQGANGVVLVTTKRGKGKLQIDYNGNFRFTTNGITGYSPTMQEYGAAWLAAEKEETTPDYWGWVSQDNLEKMKNGYEGIYQTKYWGDVFLGNANRISEMFAQRFSYQHNLSISNRTDIGGYRLSLAYADNQGNLATAYDGQKQYNLRFNYDYKLSNRVKLESGVTLQNVVTSSPSYNWSDGTLYAFDMPFFPAKNPYGQWNANFGNVGNRNAAAATSDGGRDDINGTMGRLDLKGTVQVTNDISLEGLAAFQGDQYREERYVLPVQLYDWYGNKATEALSSTVQSTGNPGYATTSNTTFYQYYSALARYNKTIAREHTITAAAGIVADLYQWKGLKAARTYFSDQGVYDLNTASSDAQTTSGGKDQKGTYSYVGRVNYAYADKYLLELQGRRDGNSRFDEGYKFKNYWGFSAGWIFTREKFLNKINDIVNFGKIRASYGSAGNIGDLGSFEYISLVNTGTTAMGYATTLQASSSLASNGLISNQRTWEAVYQQNIGIDLSFLKSRLSATFEYFIKDNKGMLVSLNYPAVLGGTAPKTNNGHLNVKGWEAIVNWKDQAGDFSYNVGFNISDTRTLLKSYYGANTWVAGKNSKVVGYAINSWFLYQTAGYFADQSAVDAYYNANGNSTGELGSVLQGGTSALRPGDTKRMDYNGDGTVSAAFTEGKSAPSDLKYMGDANPHFVFGINMGAKWKGIDFEAFFQGVGKQYIMRDGLMAYPFANLWTNQNVAYLGKTWTADNTGAAYPRMTVQTNRARWNYQYNDFMLQNSRYIRLKTLVLGYTVPDFLIRKAHLNRVRIYFSGNDLWEWTSIKDGYDPEMGEATQNVGYPFYRTWSFGVNLGL